jgi:hypothetical protein
MVFEFLSKKTKLISILKIFIEGTKKLKLFDSGIVEFINTV